jgi:hypothetical protein
MTTFAGIPFDIVQGEIRFRESDHSYWHVPSRRNLTPVSTVISTVYGIKSWDGVDRAIIDNAARRGMAVDKYMCKILRNGAATIQDAPDIQDRVVIAHRIYESEWPLLPVEPQKIVYSLEDGIAGMIDFWINDEILIDLKCTHQVEKSWILQLGGYAHMAPILPKKLGVLHVQPKLYPEGGSLLWYDIPTCIHYWRKAKAWWLDVQSMGTKQVQGTEDGSGRTHLPIQTGSPPLSKPQTPSQGRRDPEPGATARL